MESAYVSQTLYDDPLARIQPKTLGKRAFMQFRAVIRRKTPLASWFIENRGNRWENQLSGTSGCPWTLYDDLSQKRHSHESSQKPWQNVDFWGKRTSLARTHLAIGVAASWFPQNLGNLWKKQQFLMFRPSHSGSSACKALAAA